MFVEYCKKFLNIKKKLNNKYEGKFLPYNPLDFSKN